MDFEAYGAFLYYVMSPAMLSDWDNSETLPINVESTGLFRTPRFPAYHRTKRLTRPEFPDAFGSIAGIVLPIKRYMGIDIHNGSIYMSAQGWDDSDPPGSVCQTQRDWWHCACYEPGYDVANPAGSNGLVSSHGAILRTDLPDNTY